MSKLSNYYDYAAATPMLPEAVLAMQPYFIDKFYNPSALYLNAKNVRTDINIYRQIIANGLGAKSSELIFTAGGTEANNLAISGVLNKYSGSQVLISSIEHESIMAPASLYNAQKINVNPEGLIDLNDLKSKINDNTSLVSVIYANNEIGTIQPLAKIADIIKNARQDRQKRGIKLPLYFHSDACQAVNYLDLQVNRLGIDLLTINSGKIYGTKQCGALFIKSGIKISPIIYGGGQERYLRSGTENVANIAGFATAFRHVRQDYKKEAIRLTKIRDNFIEEIVKSNKNINITGPKKYNRLANNIHLVLDGVDNEWLVMILDEHGINVATGSACGASKDEPSHVLKAIGLSELQAKNSIRITLGRYTTLQNTNKLLKLIIKTVAKQ